MKIPGNPNKRIWLDYSRKGVPCPYVILNSKLAKRYSSLLQILKDLELAIQAVGALLHAPKDKNVDILKHGLLHLTVNSYAKCFTSTNGRIKLDARKYINSDNLEKLEMHEMILNLRRKYISHADTTEYDQLEIVLALDPNKKEIANIVSYVVYATEANDYLHGKFRELFIHIHTQVKKEADKCYAALRREVEDTSIEYWYNNALYPNK